MLRPCQFNITFIFTLSNDRESQDGEKTENQDRFHYPREESGLWSDDLSLSVVEQLTSCTKLVLVFARVTDSQNIQPINQSELSHFWGSF